MKDKKIISMLMSLTMIFVLLGGTLAYVVWGSNDANRTNVVFDIKDGYSCAADGGGDITSNDAFIAPASCTNEKYAIKREVTVSPTVIEKGLTIGMDLWLDINDIGVGLSESENFRYALTTSSISCDGSDGEVIVSGNFNGKNIGDKIILLDQKYYKATKNDKYYLYVWLDAEEKSTATQNQTFSLSLGGSCNKIGYLEEPMLDDGMIPVTISDDGVVTTISKDDSNWYDYENRKWANMVLVNENASSLEGSKSREFYLNNPGSEVIESDILAYYVWIPRYKYKIWTTGVSSVGQEQSIDIVFESKTNEMSLGTQVGEYRTHPAFWWDNDNDSEYDEGEMLPGIWVGKFETTGNATQPTVKPNVASLVNQNISTQFNTALKFAGGTKIGDEVAFSGNNTYGLTEITNSHMMKNSEWGAVAYLSHSQYGINDEVRINNYYNSGTLTGCGAVTANAAESATCGIPYGTPSTEVNTYPQSTTGNISGAFDMSGGSFEYVMGNYNKTIGSGALNIFPEGKYYDLYTTTDVSTACNGGLCYGHALSEIAGWYTDTQGYGYTDAPWYNRGGSFNNGLNSGIFFSSSYFGDFNFALAFRSVLIPKQNNSYKVVYDNGYSDSNLIYGLDDTTETITSDYMQYAVNNGTVTVTALSDDGYGFTNGRVYLEANKEYLFNCDVNGTWESGATGDTVEAYLMLNGQYSTYYHLANNVNYVFTPTVSGEYYLRLDVNQSGKTYSFSNINIMDMNYIDIVNYNEKYENMPIPTREGYTFMGWYTESNGRGDKVTNDTLVSIANEHMLYAHWKGNTYKVIYNNGYSDSNLIYGLDDTIETITSGKMQYTVNNGTVTVTALSDDGFGNTNGRVYLEANKEYLFNCQTSGVWGYSASDNTVEALLMLNGGYDTYYVMGNNVNYVFTPTVSGEYHLRLDVNQSGKTHTFSNISIMDMDYIGIVNYNEKYGDMPTLIRTGYRFLGWYTEPNGGGLKVTNDSLVSIAKDHIIYAHWEQIVYTVTYNLNGGSGSIANQTKIHGTPMKLSTTVPTRTGYTFLGWSTDSTATSATYSAGSDYISNESVTLYAIWTDKATYTSYEIKNLTSSGYDIYVYGVTDPNGVNRVQFPTWTSANSQDDLDSSWTSSSFSKGINHGNGTWSYRVNISDHNYEFGSYITHIYVFDNNNSNNLIITETISVPSTSLYTISYNMNGGTGSISNQTKIHGTAIKLSTTIPTRSGYQFLGWSTSSSAISSTYGVGSEYTTNASATLYAVWKMISPVQSYSCANGSVGSEPYVITYTGNCTMIDDGNNNWRIKFLTSGEFTSQTNITIDAFLVGGGGGGGYSGGGGGYTNTQKNISIVANQAYEIVVGAGGAPISSGGITRAFEYTANGGSNGGAASVGHYRGGNGGSGGGGAGAGAGSVGGRGGSNGGSGSSGYHAAGAGQGTTTREFGEENGTLYAGGGGGAGNGGGGSGGSGGGGGGGRPSSTRGGDGSTNTGGGGGGGYANDGGNGGSGIVVIRNVKNGTKCSGENIENIDFDYTYTGNCEIIDDGNGNFRIKFLTSGEFISQTDITIDAFLVGGGGGGGYSGGGGGYTITQKDISIVSNEKYEIIVGAGGGSLTSGEATQAFEYTANGGSNGGAASVGHYRGGNGGSGGGGAGSGDGAVGGSGGSNGGSGSSGYHTAGAGQGTTTREFGEENGTLYAGGGGGAGNGGGGSGGSGGGGGGGWYSSVNGGSGTPNTGGGGGGAYGSGLGGAGGSGIVVIRNVKQGTKCSGENTANVNFDYTYTGNCEIIDDGNGNWRIKFLSSGDFISKKDLAIDAFLVGGGGGGGYSGGGGGYTTTQKNISIVSNKKYEIVVGTGGSPISTGGTTKAFEYTANGGEYGGASSVGTYKAGNGGSGGGGAGSGDGAVGGGGGSNGSNGISMYHAAGTGQGTTTREFGEPTGTLYAGGGGGAGNGGGGAGGSGGGGGGGWYSSVNGGSGTPNTGGGGGGGYNSVGGSGGSGIVVIRNKR